MGMLTRRDVMDDGFNGSMELGDEVLNLVRWETFAGGDGALQARVTTVNPPAAPEPAISCRLSLQGRTGRIITDPSGSVQRTGDWQGYPVFTVVFSGDATITD